ncbi:MAG: DUF4476 domain-containing protein [Chitinophagales bacterium]|nr:DUF4476 domain-containing protein [Chitinophagales bacterium]
MKRLFTFSIISFWGISILLANPRDFPKNTNHGNSHNGGNNSSNNNYGNNHNGSHGSSNNNHGNNHYGSGHNNNHNHGQYGNNSHNNHNHHYGYSNNYHYNGNHGHSSNYYPRPTVFITPRPVLFPRPVVQVVQTVSPNYGNNSSYSSNFNYKDFLYTIKNQKFESDKLSVARQGLYNNLLDTYQIREIMTAFDYEDSRLEFAKEAYNNCVDKQNYYRVNDAFRFSSSVQQLEDYIFAKR